ncbi:MAG: MBL fold metallo-hydrolase [Bacteroidaceae bacterium]|nr:MBL fold metallo-hydrolase [Bacteroidaceae bacterium]
MELQCFEFNPIAENTYILWDDSKECVIIDAGCFFPDEYETLRRFVEAKELTVKHLLCTHFHFDHVFGARFVKEEWNVPVEGHSGDAWWETNNASVCASFGIRFRGEPPTIDKYLADGDTITFGNGTSLQCIHLPGHSKGGMVFYDKEDGVVFVGDSLFAGGGMGRTDLHGGDYEELMTSLRSRLFSLPDSTIIYPGHGPTSTLRTERWYHNL